MPTINVIYLLKYWILSILSVLLFFIGLHIGKESRSRPEAHCPLPTIIHKKSDGSYSVQIQTSPVISKLPELSTASCVQPIEQPPCVNSGGHKLSVLVKGKASVPEDVFSNLHHPSSPAKESFFLTEQPKWDTKEVLESPCQEIFLTRTGSRSNQPNKCVSVVKVPNGHESINQQSYRVGYTARNTNQYQQDYTRKASHDEKHVLPPFLRNLESLKEEFLRKMGSPIDAKGKRRTATVMVANEGVLDLLLNFMCSAEASHIDLSSVIVFVGDERHTVLIENMGAHAIYSPSLGSMPTRAADFYLDSTFSRMMWCKATSVYLALYSGFEVLFQDVDLVWLLDPFPYFGEIDSDLIFMDDGARTPRYTPFFVNSGFYFVKHNVRTLYMFESMTKAAPSEIGQTHSHQSVLIRHIAEASHLFGLRVYVLDGEIFPSGQAYHENKPLIEKIQAKAFRPYVFHMCWTDNRENKVVYFKDVGLWFLPDDDDTCLAGDSMLQYAMRAKKGQRILSRCCQRTRYWPPPTG
jgi:hypothetical protein